ncbi:MAG: ISAzo13 family transposase [Nitrospirae bacterium CG_4_10_14_3_um_filter_44_29]|jgi:transposase|nr:MAG: ISAzo13 family transposase [Nitrospirae bacterium CG22_combo_CG10-13_8_21_14_all_44_11]PIX87384.1 MAG: ISAzo13 family transposase [Nitrospirae bacterium CG_4_10_14_3_um_filter_44_29]
MDTSQIAQRYNLVEWALDERLRRLVSAAEAKVLGHGGITAVAESTGVSRRAIHTGLKELESRQLEEKPTGSRIRRPGAGRKSATEIDPTLQTDLELLVDPVTRGDPESPLRWTCKSLRTLADELGKMGHKVSHTHVGKLLVKLGYSLQGNKKTLEGTGHPDRNAQFIHINEQVTNRLAKGEPVISVDTKKKELIGRFKNNGQTWRPKGDPTEVKVYDFVEEAGRANPYGVYDIGADEGWVSVGTDHDTAAFAVQTIRRWWQVVGNKAYPNAKELFITADGGGSNGGRVRLWKLELQGLADEVGIPIRVSHYPPGTSKWNKIEHRLFSFITMNWRGEPLISHEVMLNLIANTKTKTGLSVKAELDKREYPKGIKVPDVEFATINMVRDDFHGEWNYSISPRACL